MYKINELMTTLDEFAPLSLSYKLIERGSYDNSGLLVKMNQSANKILFSLDLSFKSVLYAIDNGCDTIITHHPAIYSPIKTIDIDTDKALALAIKQGINIISLHLNLDVAENGIDSSLCQGLGGKNAKLVEVVDGVCGYGRIAKVNKQSIEEFVQNAKGELNSQKIIYYGNKPVQVIASFCGSGGSHAIEHLDKLNGVDTVVSSDFAHHQIKEFIDRDINVVIVPHYVSEQYGFKKFYDIITKKLDIKAQTLYFLDNTFM